jgi:hypothetical protein
VHDDAAWAALTAGVPTVDGRYGRFPPAYPFREPRIEDPDDRERISEALEAWLAAGGAEGRTAAVIEVEPRPRRTRRR